MNPNPKGSEGFEGSKSKSEYDQTVWIQIGIWRQNLAGKHVLKSKINIFDSICEEKQWIWNSENCALTLSFMALFARPYPTDLGPISTRKDDDFRGIQLSH